VDNLVIKTSEEKWLEKLARSYKKRQTVTLIDDANVGINPESQTILQMGKEAELSKGDWIGVGISIGMSATGIWMIVVGVADPEPTSKLGLLIGGGIVCVAGGGFSAIRILTKHTPPKVNISKNGFEISWD